MNRSKLNSDKGVKVCDATEDELCETAGYKNSITILLNSKLYNTFAAN